MAKGGQMDRAEEGTSKGEMVSPLAYPGRKGGNSLSPSPVGYDPNPEDSGTTVITPRDPMGYLPEDAKGRGKRGGASS